VNCDEARELIVIATYGRLSVEQEERLRSHSETCSACAAAYDKAKAYLSILDRDGEIPAPDWERSWNVIRARALKRQMSLLGSPRMRRVAIAGAMLAAVFVCGFLLGRHLLRPGGPAPMQAGYPSYSDYRSVSVADYSERVDMLLINFLNRSDGEIPQGFRDLEGEVIADMLAETRLLRIMADRSGEHFKYRVLEDVETVLINMSNLEPGDKSSSDMLRHFIRDKELSLRLRDITGMKSTI